MGKFSDAIRLEDDVTFVEVRFFDGRRFHGKTPRKRPHFGWIAIGWSKRFAKPPGWGCLAS